MAVTHQLTDGTTSITLNSSSGFQLVEDFMPRVVTEIPGDGAIPAYIREVLPCRINCTSADNLASQLQTLHVLQKAAAEYWKDDTYNTPVWFQQKLDAETNSRQAMVKSIAFEPDYNWMIDVPAVQNAFVTGRLVIEHHPFWESTVSVTMGTGNADVGAVTTYDYTNVRDPVGDVGARVSRLLIDVTSITGTPPIDRLWMGARSTKEGITPANFVGTWELESATLHADASTAGDATASSSIRVTVSESAANWDDTWNRATFISLSDVSANEQDHYGEHLILIRSRAPTASTWRLKNYYSSSTASTGLSIVSDVVEVSTSSWDFYPLGTQRIPFRDLSAFGTAVLADSFDQLFTVHTYAQRTSGTGDLDLDCLCLIPVDEAFCYIEDAALTATPAVLEIATTPKDGIKTLTRSATQVHGSPPINAPRFRLPTGDGLLFIAFARASSSNIADRIDVNTASAGRYVPRWVTLRGSE
jgi:hypothetical protein